MSGYRPEKPIPRGSISFSEGRDAGGIRMASIKDVRNLQINSQAELDALHKLVAEGGKLPLKPAPGQKLRRSL
ncbi:hypothetical protein [Rhizobium sp. RAF56]|uniref:hypothetical protein n=1 Tax=Rhizobium sp. RAF56 TaxID=3233062 RepID=UPI003F9D5F9A